MSEAEFFHYDLKLIARRLPGLQQEGFTAMFHSQGAQSSIPLPTD